MQLPYIFVLDWDGTIAGRVDFQSYAFNIRSMLKQYGFKSNESKETPAKAFKPGSKLIRPGFVSFIKAMQAHFHDNVHFFVYTASEKGWANQEIQWFEKANDIKFQRPIFTRDDCILDSSGSYKKSITKVYPRICRSVCKRNSLTKREKDYILHHQLIVIDNNPVYVDHKDRVLICPDYDYTVFENLYDIIPEEAKRHPDIQQLMLGMINVGVMCPVPRHDDSMLAMSHTYSWIANRCRALVEANADYVHDDFWKRLRRLITKNDIRSLKVSVIIKLQNAIWKKSG